jgi:phosphoglycolate phosphatase
MQLTERLNPILFWSKYTSYIFDADGVLWRGSKLISGSNMLINSLIDSGKQVIILTNNSTKTISTVVSKLHSLGFSSVKSQNVVSAGLVAADYLKRKQSLLPVYLFGSIGLQETLENAGVKSFGCGPDNISDYTNDTILGNVDVSQKVCAVLCSFDSHLSYVKVMKAANYLHDPDVDFVVTNEDATFPGDNPNVVIPGSGIVSAAVKCASGRIPKIMGKPSEYMFQYIVNTYSINPSNSVMIGDRLDTDIAFGNIHGLDTVLTLTGVHQTSDIEKAVLEQRMHHIPTAIVDSVETLLKTE